MKQYAIDIGGQTKSCFFNIMKKQSFRIIPITLILLMLSGTAWAQMRIATVNLPKLFDGYWKKDVAEKALKQRAADFTKESDSLREELKTVNDEYRKLLEQANDQALSSEERGKRKQAAEEKLKDLKDKDNTLKQFEQQARTSLDEQNRRMKESIIDDIRRIINARAKSAGYSIVLDVGANSANGTPVILYDNHENDITDEVMSQLNASAPIDAGTTPKSSTEGDK
jgi:Skp family chaperone for outer membrane proteins